MSWLARVGRRSVAGCLWILTLVWTAPASADGLQQVTSGGHVLGFGASGYYVSNGTYALQVEFVGAAAIDPIAEGSEGEATDGAAPLERVTYDGLWEGIRATYDTPGSGIVRSTWELAPGADPGAIRMRYNRPVRRNADGTLTVEAYASGVLSESAPVAWQEVEGERRPVQVAFAVRASDEVGFAVGAYDLALPLLIDPTLLWNTFLGGSGEDAGQGIAVDGGGNVYVAGYSDATWGSPVRAYTAQLDAFAAKLDASGALLWNTFLGGSGEDIGRGIAVDGSGNVHVAGISSATWGSPVRAYTVNTDAFAAKLDGSGAVLWNTFLGGSGIDEGHGIAVDASGNVYVAGRSHFFTWGSPVRAYTAGYDAFAAKLDASGALLWNTFLGGAGTDLGRGIAVDGSGSVYVAGTSGATWGSPVRAYTALDDAYAAKLDGSGALLWNTFLGGSGNDLANGIAVDESGNVYLAGYGGATWGSPVRAYTAIDDAFAAKLDGSGALLWNTFLGGAGSDQGNGIAVDGSGNVYAAGHSGATWASPVRAYTAQNDAFAAKLDGSGALLWNTFIGGSGPDVGQGITVDGSGNVHVAGITNGVTWGSPVRALSAGVDAFAAKIVVGHYFTLTPCRLADTRNPAGPLGGPALSALTARTFVAAGACGVPSSAEGVALNVTVTQPTAAGSLQVHSADTAAPGFATIEYGAEQTRAGNALVRLGEAGDFTVRCDQPTGTVHVIVDVVGYFE